MRRAGAAVALALALAAPDRGAALDLGRAEGAVRVATFNTALSRRGAGLLEQDILKRAPQVMAVAEILLRVRPDIVLLQEFDRDPEGRALAAFAALLAGGVADLPGLAYPHRFQGRVNSGEPSGIDLDGDGRRMGAEDAWGFGMFPGQYGMAVLSRLPLGEARSYRLFLWSALPEARRPRHPGGRPFHDDAVWQALRLSSKSHWIVPATLPGGDRLHLLAAHPTPPVFDGPEDRNGARNADEIRLLGAMIDGAGWLTDDAGAPGGLGPGDRFVVAGDLNADPADGEARRDAIEALLAHPRLRDPAPESPGAAEASARQGGANARHRGPHATDTADWRDAPGPGNLRVDYLLSSADLTVAGAGVFWPGKGDPLAALVKGGREPASSDHRLVWVDILPE
ncbi:endonuclease/exonuclease/phosphatase family protein [Limibaculum sp. FT325]|uniref:endonuclease/exonuclease/phosphatase family protein n=1 Tax=Thermohalobaculum sediminis TaxID=2939436 RepID=UPI0020BF226B|nr:endonuclease/exonuclease/phosphatase family protein [Limibaculum sediminis]MCL5777687.1 endonuclease/exonuclease/phosphatase family protein [Limibaculum sediminis]